MAETEKNHEQNNAPKKNYSLSILLFILGIVAVAALAVYTTMRRLPIVFLISELIALLSLIGLLIVSINAKRRMVRQFALSERYPYANVEKKEIEAIFDKIAEEETKRRKLDAFAHGVDLSMMPTVAAPKRSEEPSAAEEQAAEGKDTDADAADESGSVSESSGEGDIIPVFPDEDEASGKEDNSSEDSDEDGGKDKEKDKDDSEEKKPASSSGKRPQQGERSGDAPKQRKKRPSEDMHRREGQPRPRRQRPYDPYYEDYYYDNHGKRHRAPVYYDEYGNPIRPRVVYDEYGNPIRRRPADPYRDPYRSSSGKKRRPADGGKRPAPAGSRSGGSGKKRPSSGPVAPVEMTPIKQWSNYGDDYVPVAIVDEEELTPAPIQKPASAKKKRPQSAKEAASKKPYVPHFTEDEVIVTIPDYDSVDDSGEDYISPAAARTKARAQAEEAASGGKHPVQEKYVPDYSEDEGVVFIPDYEDMEDEAPAPARTPAAAKQQPNNAKSRQQPAYEEDTYEEEDEGVIVLPHDEGYEDYMEQKRAEERRAERKAKGKTALTIVKLRHKKIRRRSRKYKIFRVSLHSLSDYLNSFSVRTKH